MENAKTGAMVQHCLPAYRGQEITAEIFEEHADEIFEEAENRLHAQQRRFCSPCSARKKSDFERQYRSRREFSAGTVFL